jgi:hypothetical protein
MINFFPIILDQKRTKNDINPNNNNMISHRNKRKINSRIIENNGNASIPSSSLVEEQFNAEDEFQSQRDRQAMIRKKNADKARMRVELRRAQREAYIGLIRNVRLLAISRAERNNSKDQKPGTEINALDGKVVVINTSDLTNDEQQQPSSIILQSKKKSKSKLPTIFDTTIVSSSVSDSFEFEKLKVVSSSSVTVSSISTNSFYSREKEKVVFVDMSDFAFISNSKKQILVIISRYLVNQLYVYNIMIRPISNENEKTDEMRSRFLLDIDLEKLDEIPFKMKFPSCLHSFQASKDVYHATSTVTQVEWYQDMNTRLFFTKPKITTRSFIAYNEFHFIMPNDFNVDFSITDVKLNLN